MEENYADSWVVRVGGLMLLLQGGVEKWRNLQQVMFCTLQLSKSRFTLWTGCRVELFQHCGYGGYKHTYTMSKTTVNRGANDQYSSAKLINCGNKKVTLYQHVGYRGKSWTLGGKGDSCFVDNGFNDIVCFLLLHNQPMTVLVAVFFRFQVSKSLRVCSVSNVSSSQQK